MQHPDQADHITTPSKASQSSPPQLLPCVLKSASLKGNLNPDITQPFLPFTNPGHTIINLLGLPLALLYNAYYILPTLQSAFKAIYNFTNATNTICACEKYLCNQIFRIIEIWRVIVGGLQSRLQVILSCHVPSTILFVGLELKYLYHPVMRFSEL